MLRPEYKIVPVPNKTNIYTIKVTKKTLFTSLLKLAVVNAAIVGAIIVIGDYIEEKEIERLIEESENSEDEN